MSVIVSLNEGVEYFIALLEEFNQKTDNNKILHQDTDDKKLKYIHEASVKKQVMDLALCYLDDQMSARRKWCRRGNRFESKLLEIVPWFEDFDYKVLSEVLDDVVIHPWTVHMSRFEQHHNNQPYSVTLVQQHGLWDAIISDTGDYRIMDWERRMGNGEWR